MWWSRQRSGRQAVPVSVARIRGGVHPVPAGAIVVLRRLAAVQERTTAVIVFGGGVHRVRIVCAVRPSAGGLFRVRGTTTGSGDPLVVTVAAAVFPFLAIVIVTALVRGGERRRWRLLRLLLAMDRKQKNKHTWLQGSLARERIARIKFGPSPTELNESDQDWEEPFKFFRRQGWLFEKNKVPIKLLVLNF